ncbi:MAG: aquaporin [Steroidobacteraceae bacterium]
MSAVTTQLPASASHWPEYLIEGAALGLFMISAGIVTTALEYPGSPLHSLLPDATLRRVLIGLAMGLTAIALIHSPWGKRSGAHMNPAVTLSFLRLGRIAPRDALFYVVSQIAGAASCTLLVRLALGEAFTEAPVHHVTTQPGPRGAGVALLAEFVMAFLMMATVLRVSASARLAPYAGLCAGALVAMFISVEAPLSGMGLNPARSFASALSAADFNGLWIYLLAPPAGMLAAAELHLRFAPRIACAKLLHPDEYRCIHCGHSPRERVHP